MTYDIFKCEFCLYNSKYDGDTISHFYCGKRGYEGHHEIVCEEWTSNGVHLKKVRKMKREMK